MNQKGNMSVDEHKIGKEEKNRGDADEFHICEFLDPRKVTRIRPGSAEAPPADVLDDGERQEHEDEFDLRRSTPEEAEQFLRAALDASDGADDELAEFLDDD